jgi:acyl-CoA thioester hydrolase
MATQRHNPTQGSMADSQVDGIYRDEFTVPEAVIDVNGHVNNVAYVQWMQDIAVNHASVAVDANRLREIGSTWVARSHRIEYLSPAFAGEVIQASTWLVEASRVRARRRYQFVRLSDGVILAKGETDWVFIDANTGRPRSIPEEIKTAFTLVPDEQ